jgi:hypothetical protein
MEHRNEEELVEKVASAINWGLGIQWHYSDYGNYGSYKELPDGLKEMLREAARQALEAIRSAPPF